MPNKLPLEGIRIVDFTVAWAGPYATMLLADLGAEVIRVESIQRFARATRGLLARPPQANYDILKTLKFGGLYNYVDCKPGDRAWNRSPHFNAYGRNKYAITIDLLRPKGIALFKELIKLSDLFIENNAPAVVEKLNLTYDVLREVNPRLIMISASSFGRAGSFRDLKGFGANVDGVVGGTWLSQYTVDEIAKRCLVYPMDVCGGAAIMASAIMALHHRDKSGRGQYIDLAQSQTILSAMAEPMMDYAMNGRIQESLGNRHPVAIQGCYRCAGEDDWIVITLNNDAEWEAFCRALGNPEWTRAEKFATLLGRRENHDELDRHIEVWTVNQNKYDLMHLLQQERIPAGPVMSEADCYHDPHVAERNFFVEMTQQWCGTHLYPGFPWKCANTPQEAKLPPPGLGEHNEYVFKQILKVSDEEYTKLEEEQYIGDVYLPNVA